MVVEENEREHIAKNVSFVAGHVNDVMRNAYLIILYVQYGDFRSLAVRLLSLMPSSFSSSGTHSCQ